MIIIFDLFAALKREGMEYFLKYKLSQDYLETFFSAIRARGGFNNNPNALQFKSAYRRYLTLRHELKDFESENCLLDSYEILHVSLTKKNGGSNR